MLPEPSPQLLYRISLWMSAILAAWVSISAIYLVASKIFSGIRERYRFRKEQELILLLYGWITEEDLPVFPRTLSPMQKRLMERLILKQSHQVDSQSQSHHRLSRAFEQLGFVEKERKRLRKSWRWWVRAEAAASLGQMRAIPAKEDLVRAMRDSSLEVRLMAAKALGRMGDPEVLPPVLESLARFSKIAALRVANMILDIGPISAPTLLRLLQNPDVEVRKLAVQLLGELKIKEAVSPLRALLANENLELRIAAVQALGQLESAEIRDSLREMLRDPAWQVRAKAAQVLGKMRVSEAAEELGHLLSDSSWWVRLNAGEALSRLGGLGENILTYALEASDRFARDMAKQWLEEMRT